MSHESKKGKEKTPENTMEIMLCRYCRHLHFSMKAMKKKLTELFHWLSLQAQILRFYKIADYVFWHHGSLLILAWSYSLDVLGSNLTSGEVNRRTIRWGPLTGSCDWDVLLGEPGAGKKQTTFRNWTVPFLLLRVVSDLGTASPDLHLLRIKNCIYVYIYI